MSTHVGNPFAGADAAQLAAAIVDRVTTSATLAEVAGGVPPVALKLRDVKPRYDVQTALEADVELNMLAFDCRLSRVTEILRGEVGAALQDVMGRMERLAAARQVKVALSAPQVMTWDELSGPAGSVASLEAPPSDPRAGSWARIQRGARSIDRRSRGGHRAVPLIIRSPRPGPVVW